MSDRKVPPIQSDEDFYATMWFVICRVYATPSMMDKLPKYIMDRVDLAFAWGKKKGWK